MTTPEPTRRRPAPSARRGSDPSGSLTLTLGPTHRVEAVRISRSERLRTPAGLATVFAAAYSAALAAPTQRDAGPRPRRAERPRAVAVRPTLRPPSPEQLERHRIRNETGPRKRRATAGAVVGLSANGCVRVTLDPARSSGTVAADPGWLAHARSSTIASAITEAFRNAYAERDHR